MICSLLDLRSILFFCRLISEIMSGSFFWVIRFAGMLLRSPPSHRILFSYLTRGKMPGMLMLAISGGKSSPVL